MTLSRLCLSVAVLLLLLLTGVNVLELMWCRSLLSEVLTRSSLLVASRFVWLRVCVRVWELVTLLLVSC